MYNRQISLDLSRSFFLFGQRGTGKSSLLRNLLGQDALFIDLLNSQQYLKLKNAPWQLKELIHGRKSSNKIIVIDEVQRIPELLNEVHSLIEMEGLNFALTGSSARKLKQSGVNLLAGRAYNHKLYPLTHIELGNDFNITEVLQWGALPRVFNEDTEKRKEEYLYSYVENYLREEIILEQIVRQIEYFSRFLEIAAQSNGESVVYENIAKDIGISGVSVKSYFQILEDTLIGFTLPAYHASIRKRQRLSAKFYFHDIGLVRTLRHKVAEKPYPESYEYGNLFETFIINEIIRLNEYNRTRFKFSHLRMDDKNEVDLIIEKPNGQTLLIEIKSRVEISEREVKTLTLLANDFNNSKFYCLSQDRQRKKIGNVLCLPWKEGIEEIFS